MQSQQELISSIAQRMGISNAVLDVNRQITIAFDQAIIVTFLAEEDDNLTAVSYVADYEGGDGAIGKELLQYNFLPLVLGGGKLALDPSENIIVLTRSWDATTTDATLIFSELEAFVNSIAAIRIELEKLGSSERVPAIASPMSDPAMPYGQMA